MVLADILRWRNISPVGQTFRPQYVGSCTMQWEDGVLRRDKFNESRYRVVGDGLNLKLGCRLVRALCLGLTRTRDEFDDGHKSRLTRGIKCCDHWTLTRLLHLFNMVNLNAEHAIALKVTYHRLGSPIEIFFSKSLIQLFAHLLNVKLLCFRALSHVNASAQEKPASSGSTLRTSAIVSVQICE